MSDDEFLAYSLQKIIETKIAKALKDPGAMAMDNRFEEHAWQTYRRYLEALDDNTDNRELVAAQLTVAGVIYEAAARLGEVIRRPR